MKKTSYYIFFLIFIITVYFSCSAYTDGSGIKLNIGDQIIDSESQQKKAQMSYEILKLQTDLKRLKAFSRELETMKAEMLAIREGSKIWDLGYIPPEEHQKIEFLLFRYLAIRNSLWEMVFFYKDYRDHFSSPESQVKGFLTGYSAGLHLIYYSSLLVSTFLNEPGGRSKINEAFPRSEIPAGTYDMLFSQVTSFDNLEALKVAWVLFSNEIKDKESVLYRINLTDDEYSALIKDLNRLHKDAEARVTKILKEKSLLFPKTTNRLRHSMIVKLAKKFKDDIGDNLYAARGILFSNVSGIKMPLTRPLSFTQEQKNTIRSELIPGDIILTYTTGYMSNIFLPGKFKHGIVYIGTPRQRRVLGITVGDLSLIPEKKWESFKVNAEKEFTDSGYPADVLEAVAEGVIFNSLDLLMDTHINRMVVLRPVISEQERMDALTIALSLAGCDYDFKFDFNDGSYQCCTEVIYRSLNSRGNCDFRLVKRMGSLTLSADDILEYHFSAKQKAFEVILFAGKKQKSGDNKPLLLFGQDSEKYLKELLGI